MALMGATGHTYAVALRLQAQSIVPATAEMYAVCASRCVSQQIVPVARATAPKVSSLRKDQRRTAYIASTTTAVFRLCCGRLGTALTTVSSLRTLTRLAFVPAALVVPSSLESEGGGLDAIVIADEIHYVDFTTNGNKLCHSQEGCHVITFPRTSQLMFRLRSTCILGVEGLQSDSGCLLLIA